MPERGATAAAPRPWLVGLSLDFASHSSTSHTVTRALEKRLLQPECLGQKQMVHKLLGEMHYTLVPREEHTAKADLRCLLILLPS